MPRTCRLSLCLALLAFVWMIPALPVAAQQPFARRAPEKPTEVVLPPAQGFVSLTAPAFDLPLLPPVFISPADPAAMLHNAILKRLGVQYRFYGTDDNGYDCSGFVWRVFQDAGANFQRVAARTLWQELPAAVGAETTQFGTLVFFNNLAHVGIVRDAESFYHASRSKGVTLSNFAGYWAERITGFRRAPVPLPALPLHIGE